MSKPNHKLEAAMRFIYAHFLGDDDSLARFMHSRVEPRPNIRHLTRKNLLRAYDCTYEDICKAEQAINGGHLTDASTITHSVHKPVEKFRSYDKAARTINRLMSQFDDYWMEMHEPGINGRLAHYYSIPHHVLAVMACFAECFGWVEKVKMDGLHTEWQTVSRDLVEQKIET